MANVTTFQPAGFHFGASVLNLFQTLKGNVAARAEYNRVFNELNAMDERELSDIGIARGDIQTVAKDAAAML